MTDKQFKDYERLLPEMAVLAKVELIRTAEDWIFGHDDAVPFAPRHDDGDCLKLLIGMRSAVYKTGRRVELYGGSARVSCRIANNAAVEIEGIADRDQDAICLCAMAWIEQETATP